MIHTIFFRLLIFLQFLLYFVVVVVEEHAIFVCFEKKRKLRRFDAAIFIRIEVKHGNQFECPQVASTHSQTL